MSFNEDLYDCFDIVAKSAVDGRESLKDILAYFQYRFKAEEQYAKMLKECVRSNGPLKDEGTFTGPWDAILAATDSESQSHLRLADLIQSSIIEPLTTTKHEVKKKYSKIASLGSKLKKNEHKAVESTNKELHNFHGKSLDADNCENEYNKVMNDPSVLPAQVNKLANKSKKLRADAEDSDRKYKRALENCQSIQQEFDTEMAKLLSELQDLETLRQSAMRTYIVQLANGLKQLSQDEVEVQGSVLTSVGSIDTAKNVIDYIAKHKTGEPVRSHVEYSAWESQVVDPPPAPAAKSDDSSDKGAGATQVEALYDYKGEVEGDLSVAEGEIGELVRKDESGWWLCEFHGQKGVLPGNYLKELESKSKRRDSVNPLHRESAPKTAEPATIEPQEDKKYATAMYDYEKTNDEEINIKEDEKIEIIGDEEGGWYLAKNSAGDEGYVPANYIEVK